ncbi:MAG: SPOR domain-containing protein [Bacteroidales bacterium]|nr:SPOR domain-containing protein [Bacteroidales bacterium]
MKIFRIICFMLMCFRGFSLLSQENAMYQTKGTENLPAQVTGYKQALAEALYMQLKADSLARIARDKRILARETPDAAMKKELSDEILLAEKEAELCQTQADQLFAKAREIKNNTSNRDISEDAFLSYLRTINDIKVYRYNINVNPDAASGSAVPVNFEKSGDTPVAPDDRADHFTNSEALNTDDFMMMQESPYGEANPFPEGMIIFPGLTYRIQMGVYSNPLPFDAFGGISPVCFVKAGQGEMYKYYAGLFYSLASVTGALDQIRSAGFPDAFIVAFFDGNPISTEKAREIEYAQYKL